MASTFEDDGLSGRPELPGSESAPLYHVTAVPAFHFDADGVTLMLASTLPSTDGDGHTMRAEAYLSLGHADFERLLRRLIEVRAAMVDAGVPKAGVAPAAIEVHEKVQ